MSVALTLLTALFFSGVVNRTKSIASGRKGPGFLQHLTDIRKLFQKEFVISKTTTWIFQIAPIVQFAALLVAMSILPFGNYPGILSFQGDFVFFIYLLGTARFLLILAALDTGSAFEGMGAAREALYALLVEPAFFILIGSFTMLTGNITFSEIFAEFYYDSQVSYLLGAMAAYILLQIMMIENSRLPIDDPKTHLELTMVHEVIILDYSGPDLALVQICNHIRFAVYGTLIAGFFITPVTGWLPKIGVFFLVQAVLAMLVGLMESFIARNRLDFNAQFILSLTGMSIMIFFTVLILTHRIDL